MPDLGPSSPMPILGLQLERWPFQHFASFSLRLMSFVCLITESTYKVETKTIAVDYSQADIYPKIEKGLAGLQIGILGKLKIEFSLRRALKVTQTSWQKANTHTSFIHDSLSAFEISFIWLHPLRRNFFFTWNRDWVFYVCVQPSHLIPDALSPHSGDSWNISYTHSQSHSTTSNLLCLSLDP